MAARRASKPVSGEEFLQAFGRLIPGGPPLAMISTLVQPIYAQLGIETGKSMRERVLASPDEALVGVLCALAAGGHELRRVHSAPDGCAIEASIPSDMWSFAGQLVVALHFETNETTIEAATKIRGQFFDWGKSNRVLKAFFAEVGEETR